MPVLETAGRFGALGILAWLSLAAATPAGSSPAASAGEARFEAEAHQIITRTNAERQATGRVHLVISERLMLAAEMHARQMATAGRMAHTLTGAEHPTLADRARAVDYRYSWLSENIAQGYATSDDAVQGWMSSPPHRENMLSPQMLEIGVAIASSEDGTRYFASIFGAPRR